MLMLGSLLCEARLGESIDQCVSRFGNPCSDTGGDTNAAGDRILAFRYIGYGVTIEFRKGIAVSESILRLDRKALSDKEITFLLNAEATKLTWQQNKSGIFSRTDGATAIVIANSLLCISSKDYLPKGF
jgi:hypothetical protein